MTKADIVDNVYETVGGFSKKEASEVVEEVFKAMKETLASGDGEIKVARFGKFVVREKVEREWTNPLTGQTSRIPARRVLRFYPSDKLRNMLNPHRVRIGKSA
ncbi:MAG: HU family DNA-binding protein [Deltaproteobacteria bacterium]|jgi:integration host factor subunit alpha